MSRRTPAPEGMRGVVAERTGMRLVAAPVPVPAARGGTSHVDVMTGHAAAPGHPARVGAATAAGADDTLCGLVPEVPLVPWCDVVDDWQWRFPDHAARCI